MIPQRTERFLAKEVDAVVGRRFRATMIRNAGVLLAILTACGGGAPEPKAADDLAAAPAVVDDTETTSSDSVAKAQSPDVPEGMPARCEKQSGDICLPSEKFARALCDEDYPSVALAMFREGTVWTRGYLSRKTKAWNASGGGSSNEQMVFDEEVLILRHRAPSAEGVQISGMGDSYDVLRWDGACVTLGQGEVRFHKPPKPKHARIVFARLERHIRNSLKREPALRDVYLRHRKECKGVSMGIVSKVCVKVDGEFSRALADYIREGGDMPEPVRLP